MTFTISVVFSCRVMEVCFLIYLLKITFSVEGISKDGIMLMLFLFSFLILLVQNIYPPLLQIYEVVPIQNSMLLMHLIYINEKKSMNLTKSRRKFSKIFGLHDLHFHSFIVTYRCTSSRFLSNVLDRCVRQMI